MKERLTGANILVALIVLLVPELLTGPIRNRSAHAAASTAASLAAARTGRTAPAEPPLRSYTLTLGEAQPAGGGAASKAASTPAQASETPEGTSPQTTAQSPDTSSQDAPGASKGSAAAESDGLQLSKAPPHPAVREASSSGSSGGWVVQLGSFASRHNADHLARALESRGFRMSVSPARTGSRVLWRVRAGPAHDRAGAERLAARLRALGHRGELLPVR
ncbi:MAG TPA: SPOR domain-containing protein [Steroidobacteraceae bacterium]|nr:SPOR domain-containing protein [Steroidobacteraceae bacterium]